MLQVGSAGFLGLSLPGLLQAQAAGTADVGVLSEAGWLRGRYTRASTA